MRLVVAVMALLVVLPKTGAGAELFCRGPIAQMEVYVTSEAYSSLGANSIKITPVIAGRAPGDKGEKLASGTCAWRGRAPGGSEKTFYVLEADKDPESGTELGRSTDELDRQEALLRRFRLVLRKLNHLFPAAALADCLGSEQCVVRFSIVEGARSHPEEKIVLHHDR